MINIKKLQKLISASLMVVALSFTPNFENETFNLNVCSASVTGSIFDGTKNIYSAGKGKNISTSANNNQKKIKAYEYGNRGCTYYGQKDYITAIDCFTEALKLYSDYDCYYMRALCYKELKEYTKAISDFTQYLQIAPSSQVTVDIYKKRGECHKELGKTEEAQADFDKADSLYNDSTFRTLVNYRFEASLDYNSGDYEKAIEKLNRVIELEPNHYHDYLQRALCYQKLGEKKKFKADFKKAMEVEKSNYR